MELGVKKTIQKRVAETFCPLHLTAVHVQGRANTDANTARSGGVVSGRLDTGWSADAPRAAG